MAYRFILAFCLLSALILSPLESPRAQNEEQSFSEQAAGWTSEMDVIESLIANTDLTPEASDSIKTTLARITREAQQAKSAAEERLADLKPRLDSLGEAPEEATPEQAPVQKERGRLETAIGDANSQISLSELAITRAAGLEARIGQAQRSQLVQRLSEQGPLPYDPSVMAGVPQTLAAYVATLGEAARAWWLTLPQDRRGASAALQPLLLVALVFVAAWWIRRFLLRRFGHFPTEEPPPYSRRLLGAIADGVAKGILPAAILAIIIVRTQTPDSLLYGDFGTLVGLAAESLMIFVLATALPIAVLSPNDPNWRLTQLDPDRGRRILSLITPLALLFCIDEFVSSSATEVPIMQGVLSPAFLSIWTFGFNLAQGLITLALLRPSLWKPDPEAPSESEAPEAEPEDEADEDDANRRPRGGLREPMWRTLHLILIAVTVVGMVAPALGYTALGNYLLNNLLGSAILLSILYILRGLFRELIGLATGSAFLRDRMMMPHKTRSRLKFFSRFCLDIAIFVIGITIIAPNWGVSDTDILRGVTGTLSELQIGNVTISITDIVLAVVVFIITLALIRSLRRNLAERILPETEIEESLRHSITAGIGYVGFVVAGGLAVAVAGVDLTNIALIAGALSVGIGFGLQNIVNNFVSGLILLIERPIKVGDWVVVGANEGFVKQINMRATEIETWQKASVIVPNADLLSTALKNWTHKDKIGRVDIPIGVALDTDIDHVSNVLLEIGRAHPRCRRFPEPVALVMNVGESRIDMELRIFTSDILWVLWIASDIKKEILRRFPKEGIVIPYAQRVVHLVENGDPTRSFTERPLPAPEGQPKE